MKSLEALDLWHKFVNGDNDALSKLYNRYVHELYSYGHKIHGDDHLVKDCIQEVFINLIDKRKTLIPTESTHLYLFKSLRNKLLEELRSKNRRVEIINSKSFDEAGHDLNIEQSKVHSEEKEQRMIIMSKALETLSDYQMEAIFLKYSQGFEYGKIAEILEIDIASARTLIYRSLKKVKEVLVLRSQILFFLIRSKPGKFIKN